jgi:hypothetical protein
VVVVLPEFAVVGHRLEQIEVELLVQVELVVVHKLVKIVELVH